jgi:hypothetical protein
MRTRAKGAMLAAAVAVAFMANPVGAEDSSSNYQMPTYVACLGANSCKAQSLCKSFDHACQGMNSCKGKGFVMMKTEKECTDKGGKAIDPDRM